MYDNDHNHRDNHLHRVRSVARTRGRISGRPMSNPAISDRIAYYSAKVAENTDNWTGAYFAAILASVTR